jgi:hypothetical protein
MSRITLDLKKEGHGELRPRHSISSGDPVFRSYHTDEMVGSKVTVMNLSREQIRSASMRDLVPIQKPLRAAVRRPRAGFLRKTERGPIGIPHPPLRRPSGNTNRVEGELQTEMAGVPLLDLC